MIDFGLPKLEKVLKAYRVMVRIRFVILGFSLLLVGSYLDNLRGILLPILAREMALSYSQASLLLIVGNFASVLATVALLLLSQQYKEQTLILCVSFFSMMAAGTAALVSSLFTYLFWGALVGSAVALFGGMSNVMVIHGTPPHNRARYLCGLHTMYGLGSVLSPVIGSALIPRPSEWRNPVYLTLAFSIALIGGTLSLLKPNAKEYPPSKQSHSLNASKTLILILFAFYVAGEVLISMWMTTYLVEAKGMSLKEASPYLSGFFAMMGITRLLCFLHLPPRIEGIFTWVSLLSSLGFFYIGRSTEWVLGLTLAGIIGPFFPLVLARVGRDFPEASRSMTLMILATMQLTLALSHFLVGKVTDGLGISNAYLLPCLFLLITSFLFALYLWCTRRLV